MRLDVLSDELRRVVPAGRLTPEQVDLDEVLGRAAWRVAESQDELGQLQDGFWNLVSDDTIPSVILASLFWDGGGAPISSYLSFNMFTLGGRGYLYIVSDDMGDKVLIGAVDDPTDRQAITEVLYDEWQAHHYIGYSTPDLEIQAPELVDESLAELAIDEGENIPPTAHENHPTAPRWLEGTE